MKRALVGLLSVCWLLSCDAESQRSFRGPAARRDALSSGVVISEIFGGSGSTNPAYTHDFVELVNRGTAAVDVSNWSVQYAGATSGAWQVTSLGSFGLLQPGQHLLVRMGTANNSAPALPMHDVSGGSAMGTTDGKVALVNNTTGLTASCPSASSYVDLVGYGATANCFEGTKAPSPSATTSIQRRLQGCAETDDNAADFLVAAPTPQNAAAGVVNCATAMDPDAGASCEVLTGWPTATAEGSYDPSSNSTTAILRTPLDGGEEDILTLELYFPDGGVTLPTTETYTSTSTYIGCRTCVWIGKGCDPQLGACQRLFFPQQGSATVTVASRNVTMGQMSGTVTGLRFVEWDFNADQAVNGGSCLELASLSIDASWGGGTGTGGGTATGGGSGAGGGASTGGGTAAGGGTGTGGGTASGGGSATGGGNGSSDAGTQTDAGAGGGGSGKLGGQSGCGCTTGGEGVLALVFATLLSLRRARR